MHNSFFHVFDVRPSVQQLFRRSDQWRKTKHAAALTLLLSELPSEDCTWAKVQVSSLVLTSLCE